MSTQENLIKVYEYALNQEQTGMSFFNTSLNRMGIGAAVSAFKRLIQEEEKHILFISHIIENLKKGEDLDLAAVQNFVLEPTNYFDDRAKSEFLEQCIEGSMPMRQVKQRGPQVRHSLCLPAGKRPTKDSSKNIATNFPQSTPACPGEDSSAGRSSRQNAGKSEFSRSLPAESYRLRT
jgi:rubrerythrin